MGTRLAAVLLLVLTLLPVANLLPGGETDPGAAARLADWGQGLALCAGVGLLVWFLSRRRAGSPEGGDSAAPAGRWLGGEVSDARGGGTAGDENALAVPADWGFGAALAVAALVAYVGVALWVFDGRPLLIDEIVQVLQAREYAGGHLSQAVREPREFFSIMHWVDLGDRAYGQYPPGGPAMLVPFVLLGAEWLAGPVAGAVSVALFHGLLLRLEPSATRRFRRGTLLLFALAPFAVFMFGSHMNHATTLAWLLLAGLGLARATQPGAAAAWGLVAGLGLGVAATIRPLDAGAFALPAAAWLAWRARGGLRPLTALLLSGIGVAVPMGLMFWVNQQTTGHALQFGYDQLWGAGHALGFHEAAWGTAHTPMRGLELLGLYASRLGTYLFETPFPSTLFAGLGLWMHGRMAAFDRHWMAALVLLGAGYWAYWHDGFYLGPRFLFAALPVFVLWSARGLRALLAMTRPQTAARRGLLAGLGLAALLSAVSLVVVRVPTYRNGMVSMRIDPAREAAAAGVSNAVVLVQESWGAQLMVRMWASGVSRADAERFYRGVDACRLDVVLTARTAAGIRGEALAAELRPLLADSARLIPSERSPDFTERQDPRLAYPPGCEQRIAEDRAGYTLYAPWRLAVDGNAYLRWLPGREAEVQRAFPGRAVYRVRRDGPSVHAPLVWQRLSVAAGTN